MLLCSFWSCRLRCCWTSRLAGTARLDGDRLNLRGVPVVIVLVGEFTGRRVKLIEQLGWGRMWIARGRNIYTYESEPWGFDNGAFRDWKLGVGFDTAAYDTSLEKAVVHSEANHPPLLAVAPDIVAGGIESLMFSVAWRDDLPDTLPWYLAVQDGMSTRAVDEELDTGRWNGVFLGGTDSFKATAGRWCSLAHSVGLQFHYGRCGTLGKLEHAYEIGADSCDSALIMWTEERWQRFAHHWQHRPQLTLGAA